MRSEVDEESEVFLSECDVGEEGEFDVVELAVCVVGFESSLVVV